MEKIQKSVFGVSLVAGALVLLSSFFISFVVITLSFFTPIFERLSNVVTILLSLVPLILGILMIRESLRLKRAISHSSCTKLLVYSIVSLFLALGFVVGPVLGIIGSLIGLKIKTK